MYCTQTRGIFLLGIAIEHLMCRWNSEFDSMRTMYIAIADLIAKAKGPQQRLREGWKVSPKAGLDIH
jgi:hypothetical protein